MFDRLKAVTCLEKNASSLVKNKLSMGGLKLIPTPSAAPRKNFTHPVQKILILYTQQGREKYKWWENEWIYIIWRKARICLKEMIMWMQKYSRFHGLTSKIRRLDSREAPLLVWHLRSPFLLESLKCHRQRMECCIRKQEEHWSNFIQFIGF